MSPDVPAPMPRGATTANRVFDLLSCAIVTGALAAGSKINEPALAHQFGVSRAPLREAIRRLEERRLVTHVAHQGARVVRLAAKDIGEIYRVRGALEALAAREAASRIAAADAAALHRLLDIHAARIDAGDAYLQGDDDDDFHTRIIRASGNATLAALLLDEYYLLIRMLRGRLRRRGSEARQALLEHRRIADALAEHDGEMAEMMMQRHIAAAHARLMATNTFETQAPSWEMT